MSSVAYLSVLRPELARGAYWLTMPILDLPLEELKKYPGRNPRPVDFDNFWEKGLTEIEGLESSAELNEAELRVPGATLHHLWFTGVGGAKIHAKLARPTGVKRTPAILHFHGYTGSSGDWFGLLPWVLAGFTVAALDCRGQGGLSEDPGGVTGNTQFGHIIRGLAGPPEKLLYRQIFLDTALLARVVAKLEWVDETRIGSSGASQGGGLALACAALSPLVKTSTPIYPFLCDYRRVWEMDLAENAYRELRDYFRRYDPLHENEQETFIKLGYIDVQFLAERIQAETRLYAGLMDNVCPPSTQFAAYNKITAPKSLSVYPDFGHEGLPGSADDQLAFHAERLLG